MKHVVLHIEVNEKEQISFQKPLFSKLRQQYPEAFFFDLDIHSDAQLFAYASQLLASAGQAQIIFEAKTEATSPLLLRLLNQLLPHKEKLQVIVIGKHGLLEKMLRPLQEKARFFSDAEQAFLFMKDK